MEMFVFNEDEESTLKRMIIGKDSNDRISIILGGADDDVSLTSTNDVIRIDPNGMFIFENSTDFLKVHSGGFDVHSGNIQIHL